MREHSGQSSSLTTGNFLNTFVSLESSLGKQGLIQDWLQAPHSSLEAPSPMYDSCTLTDDVTTSTHWTMHCDSTNLSMNLIRRRGVQQPIRMRVTERTLQQVFCHANMLTHWLADWIKRGGKAEHWLFFRPIDPSMGVRRNYARRTGRTDVNCFILQGVQGLSAYKRTGVPVIVRNQFPTWGP